METSKEEEVERILEDTPLLIGAGAFELSGLNAKHMGYLCRYLGTVEGSKRWIEVVQIRCGSKVLPRR